VVADTRAGEPHAVAALDRYRDRLARGLAAMCNLLDPDVIVLGGGMSNVPEIYQGLEAAIGGYAFTDVFATPVPRMAAKTTSWFCAAPSTASESARQLASLA
jgi:fructokinase